MSAIPTVGSIVHYVSYGTPGGEYPSVCRAAIIAEVSGYAPPEHADDDMQARCHLAVMNPTGMFFSEVDYGPQNVPGTWHWPEGTVAARRSANGEQYEALRRDVAEMVVSLRQLIARPKMDLGMQISLPEDFDAERVKRDLRFAFGLCRDCGKSPCVCLRSAPCPDWSHEIDHDAHEWDAPVDGHVHCPGWPPVADGDEQGQG